MTDLSGAAVVGFPLMGEWRAINTPVERVPSHGTDFFGQRYALDFVRMDSTGTWYYPGGTPQLLRHLTIGVSATAFYSWNQPVLSAAAGRVIATGDGWPDRRRVHLPWELLRVTVAPPRIGADGDYRPLTGNYVLVESAEGIAFYGHLRCGSVDVAVGDSIAQGDLLGTIGNSGNSTMPHLHFHLMDGADPLRARGRLCAFRDYQRWEKAEGGSGRWVPVDCGIPGRLERVCATRHSSKSGRILGSEAS